MQHTHFELSNQPFLPQAKPLQDDSGPWSLRSSKSKQGHRHDDMDPIQQVYQSSKKQAGNKHITYQVDHQLQPLITKYLLGSLQNPSQMW